MKKLIIISAAVVLSNMLVFASNYPPDYANQSAVAVSQGPAFLAEVSTVMNGQKYVIGYKKTGILAKSDHVNAHVRVHYRLISFNGGWVNSMVSERNLRLLPEWSGTGFISGEIPQYAHNGTDGLIFVPPSALTYNRIEIEKIEFAFYVNGQWDSNNGQNHVIYFRTLYHAGARFRSTYAASSIAIDTWNFIVDQMKK